MKLNKKTLTIATVAVLFVAGGSAAVSDYIGLTETGATVEEPIDVSVKGSSDLTTDEKVTAYSGDSLDLALRLSNQADSDAPRVVRVLEIDSDSHHYEDLSEADQTLDVTWSALQYNGDDAEGESPGVTDVDMIQSNWPAGGESTGHKAGVANGNLVVCNAHAEGGFLESGDTIDEEWNIEPDYFSGDATYDIDYSIRDSCPV